jgi:hypothetical protein
MKPTLIRTNDFEMSYLITSKINKLFEEQDHFKGIATIDINESNDLKSNLKKLDTTRLANNYFIFTNIKSDKLFVNNYPFYKNHQIENKLILATVIDQNTNRIFPKGFKTINVDGLAKYNTAHHRNFLSTHYAKIAYIYINIELIEYKKDIFNYFDRIRIKKYWKNKIKQNERKIDSMINDYMIRKSKYQTA